MASLLCYQPTIQEPHPYTIMGIHNTLPPKFSGYHAPTRCEDLPPYYNLPLH